MQYIPKVKSTSRLSDGVQKKQRLFSGEKRPNDTVRSSSRKMQVALIHSTSERKRLPRDGRQHKETRPSSVSYTEAKSSRGKSFLSFFPTKVFGSKCEDRQESELIHGYWGRFNEQGWNSLELDGGASLVLRHLRVGGVWQDTKETGGTTSATCWWMATVGTLQPISGVKSVWRRSALLWVTTVMSSVRPEQTFSCFSSCWRLLLLRNVILWYCQYMICCCRFFFNFPFSFSSLSHVSLTQFS